MTDRAARFRIETSRGNNPHFDSEVRKLYSVPTIVELTEGYDVELWETASGARFLRAYNEMGNRSVDIELSSLVAWLRTEITSGGEG